MLIIIHLFLLNKSYLYFFSHIRKVLRYICSCLTVCAEKLCILE